MTVTNQLAPTRGRQVALPATLALLAAAAVAVALVYAVFGPTYESTSISVSSSGVVTHGETSRHSLYDEGIEPAVFGLLGWFAALGFALVAAGVAMFRRGVTPRVPPVVISVAALLLTTALFAALTIGWLFLPAALLALIAALAASRASDPGAS